MPVPQKVAEYVSKPKTISTEEIMQDLNVSRTTAKNYLSRLAKMGTIKRIGKGLYKKGAESTATIKPPPELSQIANYLRQRFPIAEFTIWSINMLAEYAHYTVSRDLIIIETNKTFTPSIRDALTEQGYHAILNPQKKTSKNTHTTQTKPYTSQKETKNTHLSKTKTYLFPHQKAYG